MDLPPPPPPYPPPPPPPESPPPPPDLPVVVPSPLRSLRVQQALSPGATAADGAGASSVAPASTRFASTRSLRRSVSQTFSSIRAMPAAAAHVVRVVVLPAKPWLSPAAAALLSCALLVGAWVFIVCALALPFYSVVVSDANNNAATYFFSLTAYSCGNPTGTAVQTCSNTKATYSSVSSISCGNLTPARCASLQAAGAKGASQGGAGIALLVFALLSALVEAAANFLVYARTRGWSLASRGGRPVALLSSAVGRAVGSALTLLLVAAGTGLGANAANTIQTALNNNSSAFYNINSSPDTAAIGPGQGLGALAALLCVPVLFFDAVEATEPCCGARYRAEAAAGETSVVLDSSGQTSQPGTPAGSGRTVVVVVNSANAADAKAVAEAAQKHSQQNLI